MIRQASDYQLPALVAQLARNLAAQAGCDPLTLQEEIEALVDVITGCRCTDLRCSHNCNYCTPESCEFVNRPYYCEDCFAFVPDLPSFCHCARRIVITIAGAHRR